MDAVEKINPIIIDTNQNYADAAVFAANSTVIVRNNAIVIWGNNVYFRDNCNLIVESGSVIFNRV